MPSSASPLDPSESLSPKTEQIVEGSAPVEQGYELELRHKIEATGVLAKCGGLLGWSLLILCWASLIWLPALALTVGIRVRREGPKPHLMAASAAVCAAYLSPLVADLGEGSLRPLLRSWLSFFRSVELWLPKGAISPERATLYCYHPHGVFSVGSTALSLAEDELFAGGVVALASEYIHRLGPLLTSMIKCTGPRGLRIDGVSRESFHRVLESGQNAFFVPGGGSDRLLVGNDHCYAGHERLWLRRRRGFVKYALQHGYSLTPIYAFGETDTYNNVQGGMGWRLWLNKGMLGSTQGIPTVLPYGWWMFPLVPNPSVRLIVVVGPPLKLPHITEPSSDDIERWHAAYVDAITRLYSTAIDQIEDTQARPLEIF